MPALTQEAAERVAGVRGSLQAELDALGEGLRLRQEAAAARGLLELMQDMAHTMSKVGGFGLAQCLLGFEKGFREP